VLTDWSSDSAPGAALTCPPSPDPTVMSQRAIWTISATEACPGAISNIFYGEAKNSAQIFVACERIDVSNTCGLTGA